MNTSVPSAIAHIHNMVMAIWIITCGKVEQILNAVHLPAVLKPLKMREQGLSCSELLCLPYFDVVQCIVVDAMHNLFLGLIKAHFIGILWIALPQKQKDPVFSVVFSDPPTHLTENEKKSVEKLKKWLVAPTAMVFSHQRELAIQKLKRLHARALRFACN